MNGRHARRLSHRSAATKGIDLAAAIEPAWEIVFEPADKAPQRTVGYQTQPNGGRKCSACANFRDGCTMVQGPISPDGWCQLYREKLM